MSDHSPEAVPTASLAPRVKRALLTVVTHGEVTAREVSLDLSVREWKAREALGQLERLGLIVARYNGHAIVSRATGRGHATVELMGRERVARAQHEAILAAADPASLVTCPTCRGERRYCATCTGSRVVTAEQAAEV